MDSLSKKLLPWYRRHRRDMPWRKTKDPYRILLSEIMLQQTQVQTVIPYYHRFLKRFPTFQSLARAPMGTVLKRWEGLGYYSRARNLHKLARIVVKSHAGKLPLNYDALLALPGIGRYTAGAVLSIAFGKDYPVVDGNVMRVLARHYAVRKDITRPETQKWFWKTAERLLPRGQSGDFNQALMELGATICTPQTPECKKCPLTRGCKAREKGLQYRLPIKKKNPVVPHFDIGAAVVARDGKLLISQRPLDGLLGGLWEFPGGKRLPGEPLPQTVRREIKEELGIEIHVGQKLVEIDHAYSHFKITLHAYDCTFRSGEVQALEVRAWKWVKPSELKRFAFPAANQPIIRKLLDRARSAPGDGA